MKKFLASALLILAAALSASAACAWTPERVSAEMAYGHLLEKFTAPSDPSWGYPDERSDIFALYHPTEGFGPHPLCVMFHSAGGGIDESLSSAFKPDGCDVYHMPDTFYSLHLDCLAHKDDDWWWGGVNPRLDIPENKRNSGFDLQPVEKRVMATIHWVLENYDIDPNRVYLCGNSMGGSGTLGIGLRHGDIFAAIKANVPAGVLHAANRIGLPPYEIPAGVKLPDPPICIDYSGTDDVWSVGHELLYTGMAAKKYAIIGYWGNFGHENSHEKINKVNDLIDTIDWTSIRKNEAYPVFTGASSDTPLPWPDQEQAVLPGQVNAYFRWTVYTDTPDRFEIALRLTDAEELGSALFTPPAESTADLSLRRLQQFKVAPGDNVRWNFAGEEGTVTADADGLVTIPSLKITTVPALLTLSR
ncbi:MAG: hypothetical protein IJG60_08785 [Thermoguttaceae bacterium]|nr:hypothetical protein [Thermoguttaceae bacterium]